jgi:hypothetical protein
MTETKLNDPGLPVVNIKRSANRLQELCAQGQLNAADIDEIERISCKIVRDSSAVVVWADQFR